MRAELRHDYGDFLGGVWGGGGAGGVAGPSGTSGIGRHTPAAVDGGSFDTTWWRRKSSPVLLLWSHAAAGIDAGGTVVGAIGVIGVSTHRPDEGNSSPEACPQPELRQKSPAPLRVARLARRCILPFPPPPIAFASAARKVEEPAPRHDPTIKDGVRGQMQLRRRRDVLRCRPDSNRHHLAAVTDTTRPSIVTYAQRRPRADPAVVAAKRVPPPTSGRAKAADEVELPRHRDGAAQPSTQREA